ncbi:Trm112 family protein [Rhodococcus triatomae]|uniref:Trm112 family protein n=1 Tax=Rhodococcus triatomae TaxID=300028 RepID=UPI0009333709|nr:Trm112 family protein [Rhodococcus triatomae]QNG18668.1 Trm112 family protein [Rhodococcus triatomae]QNG21662.1 Trm112 family protein [Rhodococcus triatomae]
MAIDPTLLSILACPQDKGPLLLIGDELLYNPRLRRAYPIDAGIPVLLVDEARDVDAAEHDQLLARADAPPSADS